MVKGDLVLSVVLPHRSGLLSRPQHPWVEVKVGFGVGTVQGSSLFKEVPGFRLVDLEPKSPFTDTNTP